jgi:hypothetical protein
MPVTISNIHSDSCLHLRNLYLRSFSVRNVINTGLILNGYEAMDV